MDEFGKKIKQLRIERGLTLEQVEKDLGITNSAVSKWERGEREPKLQNVKMLAAYYGVSFAWLAGESDNPYIYPIKAESVPGLVALQEGTKD